MMQSKTYHDQLFLALAAENSAGVPSNRQGATGGEGDSVVDRQLSIHHRQYTSSRHHEQEPYRSRLLAT